MKKIIFAILFAILGISVMAQEGVLDTIEGYYGYSPDSVIVFTSAEYYGCPNNYTINTQNMPSAVDYFNDYNFAVNPPVYNSVTGSWIPPFQVNFMLTTKNNYEVEAYAQPHHFDSVVYVCGVAAHVGGKINQVDKNWLLLDENFDTLAMTPVYPWYNGPATWQNLELHYYYFPEPVPVQDFYIAGEQYIYEKDAPITFHFRYHLAGHHHRLSGERESLALQARGVEAFFGGQCFSVHTEDLFGLSSHTCYEYGGVAFVERYGYRSQLQGISQSYLQGISQSYGRQL